MGDWGKPNTAYQENDLEAWEWYYRFVPFCLESGLKGNGEIFNPLVSGRFVYWI